MSTDRDMPLIWVCIFSDLVRVWVGTCITSTFYQMVLVWVVILYQVKNTCFIGNLGNIQT